MTLILVRKENKLLLGYKKRGFGSDKWNGFGGKVEKNETIVQGAMRELREECGLTGLNPKFLAILEFYLGDKHFLIHLFTVFDFEGEIIESEEMKPEWFSID